MGWRQWKLEDWNRALVAAVFFDQERLEQPVKRIEASGKFLAKASGDASASHAQVREAFIASFGKRSAPIRAYYVWSPAQAAFIRRCGYPSTFAPLYLTLLAASADETTYLHGDFRDRFAALLEPVGVGRLPFADLAKLWEHVRNWSKQRAKQSHDCRVLQLPPVRDYDRRISHSKLLAFPAYSDELKLREILDRADLDSHSTFKEIALHVSSRLGKFSHFFQEEFDLFRSHVSRAQYQEAYQTPFWSAIETITWENRRELSRAAGEFALGVDVSDPAFPEFYLLADDTAGNKLASQLKKVNTTVPGKLHNLIQFSDGRPWKPALVESVASFQVNLTRLQLWKRLKSGCLALYPDEYGNITSEGLYCDGAAACILAKGHIADEIAKTSKTLGLEFAGIPAGNAFAPWRVFLFSGLREEHLQRLAEDMPADARQGLKIAWQPPRIHFSGGAWDGQMLLLNPASVPLIGMREIAAGSFQIVNEHGDILCEGILETTGEEGRLSIPPKALVAIGAPHTLKVSATTIGGHLAESSLRVTTIFPPSAPLSLADQASWLADGPGGTLSYIDGPPGMTRQSGASAGSMRLPKFEHATVGPAMQCTQGGLDALPAALDWLCEALSLRFRSRATLPFAQLENHIRPASIAAGIPTWKLKRLLLSAGWLQTVHKRGSPYAVVTVAPRTISLHEVSGKWGARISGLLSKSERAALAAMLTTGEQALRTVSGNLPLGIGVIKLQLAGPGRVASIAQALGLETIQTPLPAPLSPPHELFANIGPPVRTLPVDTRLEVYNGPKQQWEPAAATDTASVQGTCIRLVSNQRRDYWIFTGAGYIWTDSLTWLMIFRAGIASKPFGQVLQDGNCIFARDLPGLPAPLVQWWLHRGGGYVGIGDEGQLAFAGGASNRIWEQAVGWFPSPGAGSGSTGGPAGSALERRHLALALRKKRARRDSWPLS